MAEAAGAATPMCSRVTPGSRLMKNTAGTRKGIPAGRFGDPEKDIGRTAVFLCSEDAKYISGETITMQGGSGLRP